MVNNPVGVTIAIRKIQEGESRTVRTQEKIKVKKQSKIEPMTSNTTKPKPSSWQVLFEGTAMYVGCLILPSLLGYVYQLYLNQWNSDAPASYTKAMHATTESSLSSMAYSVGSFYYETLMTRVCPDPTTVDADSYTAYVCPVLQEPTRLTPLLYSQDTAWSDVQLISLLSMLIAFCRILLVHYLVPRDYESFEALMRCKSSHLLSSDYAMSPNTSRRNLMDSWDEDDDDIGMRFDESDRELSPPKSSRYDFAAVGQSQTIPAEIVQGVYSAPRFATAVFRLLYTASAVALAFYSFHQANFWPWYVLGRGSTKNCWDLSGGLTLGMDSDFDQCNSMLRRYFLWQASYHWHSGAFHVWSLAMLLKNPNSAPRRFLSVQSSTASYVRSLGQHLLLLAAIVAAYIFSSLRRLGAIGMFAFDVSSCFLHLLQICTNAPEKSAWRRPKVVRSVYYGLVLPSYVVTRLVVWPLLWYSASFESEKWLRQLEQTLVPGSAGTLKGVMHALMFLLMATTLINLKRLCQHSQVQRALQNAH